MSELLLNQFTRQEINLYIGNVLLQKRQEAGMPRTELARHIGRSHQQLEKYEKGINRTPGDVLFVASNLLRFDYSDLFPVIDHKNQPHSKLTHFDIEIIKTLKLLQDKTLKKIICSLLQHNLSLDEKNKSQNYGI